MALTKEPRKILSSLNVVKQAFEMLQRFRFQQEVTWLWVAWSGTSSVVPGTLQDKYLDTAERQWVNSQTYGRALSAAPSFWRQSCSELILMPLSQQYNPIQTSLVML
jgi:hypothetical protein